MDATERTSLRELAEKVIVEEFITSYGITFRDEMLTVLVAEHSNKNAALAVCGNVQRIVRHIVDSVLPLLEQVERMERQNQWIPVTERLPENNTVCVGYVIDPSRDETDIANLFFEDGDFVEYDGHIIGETRPGYPIEDDRSVTHWRPLPQPPERGEETKK